MADATPPIDPELRRGFERELELQMGSLVAALEQLIEMHDRYGDTLQKPHLLRARRELLEGIGWFHWARRRRT